jgi:hypothetical protein
MKQFKGRMELTIESLRRNKLHVYLQDVSECPMGALGQKLKRLSEFIGSFRWTGLVPANDSRPPSFSVRTTRCSLQCPVYNALHSLAIASQKCY